MSSMQERIFRTAALARRASPDGLDMLLDTTTVPGWIGLIALTAVVIGALVWGVLGRIPQVVEGQGIMVSDSGLFRVQAPASGQIDSLLTKEGDTVRQGQRIAVLAQPALETSITQLEAALAKLKVDRDSTANLLETSTRLADSSIQQQIAQANEAIKAAERRLDYLDRRIANESVAVDSGWLPSDVVENTKFERAETQLQLLSTTARKQELERTKQEGRVASLQSLFILDQQIRQTQYALSQDSVRFVKSRYVESEYAGEVVERLADVGQTVVVGDPLITVVAAGEQIVWMFIPLEGKRIQPNMPVQMVPWGVRPEETGYFLGEVRGVSAAPLSGNALDRYLKNEVLVQQFTGQGGAYRVAVNVERDTSTVSGFKWTSREGPQLEFGEGTLVTGKIVVERARPIALIVPALRRWLRG